MQPEENTKLYRSYCLHSAAAAMTRHRGKSPRQAAFFFKNPEVKFHAAQLESLFLIYGLVGAARRAHVRNCKPPKAAADSGTCQWV